MKPKNLTEVQARAWNEFQGHVEAFAPRFQQILSELACDVPVTPDLTGGIGGVGEDQEFRTFSHDGLVGEYHVYAAGLDWTRPVGLLIYTDGTGEYGLKNPTSTYLMAGPTGLAVVAKRHNMVLLTPMAPGGKCDDATGVCWYQNSGPVTSLQKAAWSAALISHVHSLYNIDRSRTCFAGYSSGAEWVGHFFGPKAASSLISGGVGVCISYGGYYGGTPSISEQFRRNVAMVWDCGDTGTTEIAALNAARKGEAWYRGQGFKTGLNVVAGQTHSRSGQFAAIVEREINQHVRPA